MAAVAIESLSPVSYSCTQASTQFEFPVLAVSLTAR